MMIRSFAAEDQTEEEGLKRLADHKSARMRRTRFSNLCNIGFGTAMSGMYLFGAVYCAYGILTDTVTFGTMTAITQLISQIQSPFANITGYLPRYYAMTACADEFITELEGGIDTLLGERGTGLSEGQMQRIAIARAIYSESPILLLDEATSALDTGTEKRLLQNLRSMTDKTVVIVTHRPAALEICDRVIDFSEIIKSET